MLFRKKLQLYDRDIVGCFGKLPCHAEFIQHRVAAAPEIIELDRWYQQGFQALSREYGDNLKTIFPKMPTYHFLYIVAEKLPLLGTFQPSYDKGGRIYPFVLFRLLEHPLAQEFKTLIPVFFFEYLQKSQSLLQENSLTQAINTVMALQKVNCELSRRNDLEQAVIALQTATLANFSDFDIAQLQQYKEKIFSLTANPQNLIQVPLCSNPYNAISVSFWLQLFEFANGTRPVKIFWTRGNQIYKPHLWFCLNQLEPETINRFINDEISQTAAIPNLLNANMSLFAVLREWSKKQ